MKKFITALILPLMLAAYSSCGTSHNRLHKEMCDEPPYWTRDYHSEVFDLKGSYKLHQYLSDNKRKLDLRLVGNNLDTVIMSSNTEYLHGGWYKWKSEGFIYQGIDFDDYLAIPFYQYYFIFDKRTGERLGDIHLEGYDAEHNLIISSDSDSGEEHIVLKNLKTGKGVDIQNYYPKDADFTGVQGVWNISKVTGKWIYLLNDTGLKPIKFRIPASAIGLTTNSPKEKEPLPHLTVTTTFEGEMEEFSLTGSGEATIDWGDGSPLQVVALEKLPDDVGFDCLYSPTIYGHPWRVPHTYAAGSGIKTITVTGNDVTGIYTGNTGLDTAIDVSCMPRLLYLICGGKQLISLDVSRNSELQWLDFSRSGLSSIDLSKNSALKVLHCTGDSISTLDLSHNHALETLVCYESDLSLLDIGGCNLLIYVDCSFNHLSTMDISSNTALVSLFCDHNILSSLDISQNVNLSRLHCEKNRLLSLDVSNNMKLNEMYCFDNQFDREALVKTFKGLPSGGKYWGIIRCGGSNPGWSELTDEDKAIAERKRWAIKEP